MPGCNTKPNVCQNGGTCVSALPDATDNRTYRCLCRNNYYGAHCTLIGTYNVAFFLLIVEADAVNDALLTRVIESVLVCL